nr:uncharacterized protein LOC128703443 [Cherax quadricarinatus]
MNGHLQLALLAVALSSVVTSQPFSQSEASKHSDFQWNIRKIGSRKVATISIRKDEERDRRSIPLTDDEAYSRTLPRHHQGPSSQHRHRHHHGQQVNDAVLLADEDAGGRREDGRRHLARDAERSNRGMSPLHVAETGLERFGAGDVSLQEDDEGLEEDDEGLQEDDVGHFPRLQEVLDDAGIHLSPSLFRNLTEASRPKRNRTREPKKKGSKKNKRKSPKNKKKKTKNKKNGKGAKNCRKLKRNAKKACREAFQRCRDLRGKAKKVCRAQAAQTYPDRPSPNETVPEDDMFSFIKNITEMSGSDACQYHHLEQCCRRVGLPSTAPEALQPVVKCRFREEFLKCMEEQRMGTCDPNFQTRGDLAALRSKISEVIWTTTSCLISEVEEG